MRDIRANGYLVLAMPIGAVFIAGDTMLKDISAQIKKGWITNFVILCPGVGNRPKNTSMVDSLSKMGHKWATKHIVCQLSDESIGAFVRRTCDDYGVSHFVDSRKACIKYVVQDSSLAKVKIYQIKPGCWGAVRTWMSKTSPRFYTLVDKADDSFQVIRTGFTMSTELGAKEIM